VATYIRFAVATRDASSDQQQGVFTALYALEDARALLPKDIAVEEFRTDKPGYIVYEDAHQVAAIPFTNETF
jgi:hypothetical protein